MEIVDGVLRIPTPLEGRLNDVYAFVGDERVLIFDTGTHGSHTAVLQGLHAVGVDPARVSHIVVSHCDVDHFGGLRGLSEAFPNAASLAHPADAPMMEHFDSFLAGRGDPFRAVHELPEAEETINWMADVSREAAPDLLVSGGERIDIGGRSLEVLHLPGHSRGHLGIRDAGRGVLAVSDAILGSAVPAGDGSPLFPPTYRHTADYRATIRRVRDLRTDVLATAHYGIYRGAEVDEFLDGSMAFCDEVAERVKNAIANGVDTLRGLVTKLLPDIGSWPREGRGVALAFPVVGHLEELAETGQIEVDVSTTPARMRMRRD